LSTGQLNVTADHSPFGVFLLVIALVLLLVALRHLRRALMPVADLMRMVLSAGLVFVLIMSAVLLLVASVVVRP
jgi:hypothetical protein